MRYFLNRHMCRRHIAFCLYAFKRIDTIVADIRIWFSISIVFLFCCDFMKSFGIICDLWFFWSLIEKWFFVIVFNWISRSYKVQTIVLLLGFIRIIVSLFFTVIFLVFLFKIITFRFKSRWIVKYIYISLSKRYGRR